ncbi:hypothetical protein BH11VER1_BH11VER1_33820 [soil metagenome]
MEPIKIDLLTFDIGAGADSPGAYAAMITKLVSQSWDEGAEVVLLPEFAWLGLERFVEGENKLAEVATLFWLKLWPDVQKQLSHSSKVCVLGTAPCMMSDGTMRNRAPILCEGRSLYQDKINLTPWETGFTGGDSIELFEYKGLKMAVIICLDIEVPELSVALRQQEVDVILVPSATESAMGLERVGRCASARAVELGCYVGVAHLVGMAESELVDENVGRLAWFTPSQSSFRRAPRENISEHYHSGFHCQRQELDLNLLLRMRRMNMETNPSQLNPRLPLIKIIASAKSQGT